MSIGELIQDAAGVAAVAVVVGGIVRAVYRWSAKSKQREIDDRVKAAIERRDREQKDGTPVEKELRRQLAEIKQELADVRAQHRQEIGDLRAEHDREIADLRRQWQSDTEALRGQITEAYRNRPSAR